MTSKVERGGLVPVLPVLAVGGLTLAASSNWVHIAVFSSIGALVVAVAITRRNPTDDRSAQILFGSLLAVVIVALTMNPQREGTAMPESQQAIWAAVVVAMGIAGFLTSRGQNSARKPAILLAVAAFAFPTIGIVVQEWQSPAGFDVYLIHLEAGEALSNGLNPYSGAVEVDSGSSLADPDATIVGYPYPPPALGTYGLSAMVTDPRVVSLIASAILIGGLALQSWRRADDGVTHATLFLLASLPIWRIIWFGAWTEPLTLMLMAGALVLWRRSWPLSGILLGMAFASKQYMVFLLPLVLFHRDDDHLKRLLVAALTGVATIAPFLILDARGFYDALITNLTEISFRPDTMSLSGLLYAWGIEFELPRALWFLLVGAVAVILGRRSTTPRSFAILSAVVLGFAFLTGLAFVNYWYLVAWLVALGVVTEDRSPLASSPSSAVQPHPV